MRLPNGFGQISQIKNARLRQPYRAMVTIGKDENGKPICRLLKPQAYFKTYNEAYAALVEYNKKPYLEGEAITEDVFEEWIKVREKEGLSDQHLKDIKRCWRYCSDIYRIPIRDLRAQDVRNCVENGSAYVGGKIQSASPLIQKNIKTVLNTLFDYALSFDLVEKNYARNYKLPKNITAQFNKPEGKHLSYTEQELTNLWKGINNYEVKMLLIQCYSGWRPQELMDLKISDIDLENETMTGGMKTSAGKNRVVPIHPKILKYVIECYNDAINSNSEYLFNREDRRSGKIVKYNYHRYDDALKRVIKAWDLDENHHLHDARKTFVTLCKKYNVDEYAIKRFVGHQISDLTERVYTDRDLEWYKSEIAKIK